MKLILSSDSRIFLQLKQYQNLKINHNYNDKTLYKSLSNQSNSREFFLSEKYNNPSSADVNTSLYGDNVTN